MRWANWSIWLPISSITIASLALIVWVARGTAAGCPMPDLRKPPPPNEFYVKMFSALDSIVDLDIKLATTLTGFGAAILLGLKSGVALPKPVEPGFC